VASAVADEGSKAREAAFQEIEPVIARLCYDCHGDGEDSGGFVIDDYETVVDHLSNFEVWYDTWKNVRSNLMPPADRRQPSEEERAEMLAFIEDHVFRIDRENPDPGRVTIRRLNREEYRHTVRDLLRVDINVHDILPPDDTGYGFDTIGDVLSISPLLMEKYLEAAEEVVEKAIPRDGPQIVEWWIERKNFRDERNEDWSAEWMPFDHARKMQYNRWVDYDGEYELRVDLTIKGSSEASSHTAHFSFGVDDTEVASRKVGWDNTTITLRGKLPLKRGRDETFWLKTETAEPPQEGEKKLAVSIESVRLRGPLDGSQKDYPWGIRYLFSEGPPSEDKEERQAYRESILRQFATRAFRRPVDDDTVARLATIAKIVDEEQGDGFENGIARAVTAILVSPRFLMRAEVQPEPDNPGKIVPVDEYSLASRLSYFLWSSLPDEELMKLAEEGKLRENWREQIDRLLADEKSDRFVRNFVGQWLHARDVTTVHIDERRALGIRNFSEARRTFNNRLRQSMQSESEEFFAYILREGKPATDLLTANYTFLNEPLAEWYDIEGVKGNHMRLVELPEDSVRGGILTQATFHIVTSSPTRTSPVIRGLFVLENFLATPPPPAVPDVPALEEVAAGPNKDLPLRELLALHAEQRMCASCHARMDPIGLALENFNVVGLWRDEENEQPIDSAGKLMTGEEFSDARELSHVLATARRSDFHRALAEKLLVYSVGRGIEYFDAPTIDQIVAEAEAGDGTLREILYGVLDSAPFQKRRGDGSLLDAGE